MIKKVVGVVGLVSVLAGCGQVVEVPPAHIGKIMTKDGYQEGEISTSKFRLPWCFSYCDKLVLLDTSDQTKTESMVIFIPTDKLNLEVIVQTTLSLNPAKTSTLFGTITPVSNGSDSAVIPWNKVYTTYAQQIIKTEVREYLSKYSISQIASSMDKVNSDLREVLSKTLVARTPFDVRYVGLTSVSYPKIITEAQEKAATRREQIQQEEAQLKISKVKLERELQEARLQRQIDFEKAEGEAAAQKIQKEVVDDRVLQLRKMENERLWIEKWDGKMPTTALGEAVPMYSISK